jgi:hypothetical protein
MMTRLQAIQTLLPLLQHIAFDTALSTPFYSLTLHELHDQLVGVAQIPSLFRLPYKEGLQHLLEALQQEMLGPDWVVATDTHPPVLSTRLPDRETFHKEVRALAEYALKSQAFKEAVILAMANAGYDVHVQPFLRRRVDNVLVFHAILREMASDEPTFVKQVDIPPKMPLHSEEMTKWVVSQLLSELTA